MFIVGDGEMLRKKNQTWSEVIQMLEDEGQYGEYVVLQCQNHRGQETRVRRPEDFKVSLLVPKITHALRMFPMEAVLSHAYTSFRVDISVLTPATCFLMTKLDAGRSKP